MLAAGGQRSRLKALAICGRLTIFLHQPASDFSAVAGRSCGDSASARRFALDLHDLLGYACHVTSLPRTSAVS